MRGKIHRSRLRVGHVVMLLGGWIHVALIDLGDTIAPALLSGDLMKGRKSRPWLGLVIIVLLVAGLLFVGDAGLWLVREAAPHREQTP